MFKKRVLPLERTLVVGVDVASEKHVAVIRGPGDVTVGPFTFANDRSGFQWLTKTVARVQGGMGRVEVVLALARWARERGWRVIGVLGAHTSRAKELWGNSPLKSDPKDAHVICDLAVEGKWVTFSLREGAYAELKALVTHRQQLVRHQTALKNQTSAWSFRSFCR